MSATDPAELLRRLEQVEGELAELARIAAADRRVDDLEREQAQRIGSLELTVERLQARVRELERVRT